MNSRKKSVPVAVILALLAGLVIGASGDESPGAEPVRLLVIDETHSIQSSLQIGQFALALRGTGLFDMDARTDIPLYGNSSGWAYDLVLIVPESPSQLWIVTADLPATLSPPVQAAFQVLKNTASFVYEGESALDARSVVDVIEDLFPAIYGGLLAQNGWLRLIFVFADPSLSEGDV
jgi:hypothetical protein